MITTGDLIRFLDDSEGGMTYKELQAAMKKLGVRPIRKIVNGICHRCYLTKKDTSILLKYFEMPREQDEIR